MNAIKIEIHNADRAGTYVRSFSGADWQAQAREWIKETAQIIRGRESFAVWAIMSEGNRSRRIEA